MTYEEAKKYADKLMDKLSNNLDKEGDTNLVLDRHNQEILLEMTKVLTTPAVILDSLGSTVNISKDDENA